MIINPAPPTTIFTVDGGPQIQSRVINLYPVGPAEMYALQDYPVLGEYGFFLAAGENHTNTSDISNTTVNPVTIINVAFTVYANKRVFFRFWISFENTVVSGNTVEFSLLLNGTTLVSKYGFITNAGLQPIGKTSSLVGSALADGIFCLAGVIEGVGNDEGVGLAFRNTQASNTAIVHKGSCAVRTHFTDVV